MAAATATSTAIVALSYGNRQRAQTSAASWRTAAAVATPTSTAITQQQQQQQQRLLQQHLLGRKQNSFIDYNTTSYGATKAGITTSTIAATTTTTTTAAASATALQGATTSTTTTTTRGILTRGGSVDRYIIGGGGCGVGVGAGLRRESVQQRLKRATFQLHKHSSINQTFGYHFANKQHSQQQQQTPLQQQQHHNQQQRRNYTNLLNHTSNNNNSTSNNNNNNVHKPTSKHKKDGVVVAWSSTTSLLKAFNDELSNDIGNRRKNNNNYNNNSNNANQTNTKSRRPQSASVVVTTPRTTTTATAASTAPTEESKLSPTAEVNRINLNIVLAQTIRATNEIEATHEADTEADADDVDSCSEAANAPRAQQKQLYNTTTTAAATTTTASNRRANFQAQRSAAVTTLNSPIAAATTITTSGSAIGTTGVIIPTTTTTATTTATTTTEFVAYGRRQPLVRAMSAPVRCSLQDTNQHHNNNNNNSSSNNNTKNIFAANKRKPRNRCRKTITRNISCDKTTTTTTTGAAAATTTTPTNITDTINKRETLLIDGSSHIVDGNKKLIARARSTATTAGIGGDHVITLVSLISSELSDSEKEDDISIPLTANSDSVNSASSTRAPLLRKTGKSVSFQETFMYPPNYQLAAKEYSHMIRRGSIAPLATRLRSNRPPTAPPVSIFLADTEKSLNQSSNLSTTESMATNMKANDEQQKERNEQTIDNKCEKENMLESTGIGIGTTATVATAAADLVYPQYVRSLKERECWKLYQKMLNKGVNVSYETVLRGMLTPTEFRQVQKQRELEDAKLRALEELDQQDEKVQLPTTAIERLSETLLQK